MNPFAPVNNPDNDRHAGPNGGPSRPSRPSSPPPQGPPGSWNYRTESWNCQTTTCWWFTYIRDTLWQYCSFWGFINLIFFLGVGTVILDWVLPTLWKVVMYLLCNCCWRPLCRTKAVVAKEKEKEQDMRQKMRERYTNTDAKKSTKKNA